MAFGIRRFSIHARRFKRRNKRGKVSLIPTKRIVVNGQVKKPGSKVQKSRGSSQLRKTVTRRK